VNNIEKDCESGTGGAGWPNNLKTEEFQQYYGLAIQRNIGDLQAMRRAILSTYIHKSSTGRWDDDTSLPDYQTTRRNNPQESHLQQNPVEYP
jgi:hypothetical protein